MTEREKIELLHSALGFPLIDCSKALKKFNNDEIASYYYLKTGKNPYYYVIYSKDLHSVVSIVENEDVAKDFCSRESKYFYIKKRIQQEEIKRNLGNCKILLDFGEKVHDQLFPIKMEEDSND